MATGLLTAALTALDLVRTGDLGYLKGTPAMPGRSARQLPGPAGTDPGSAAISPGFTPRRCRTRRGPGRIRWPETFLHPPELVRDNLAHRSADHDPAELRVAILLEELAVYVFEWPPVAAYNDWVGVARVRRRARTLADHLGDAGIGAGLG